MVLQSVYINLYFRQNCIDLLVGSTSSPTLYLFYFSHCVGCLVILNCGFSLHFSGNWSLAPFPVFFGHLYTSFVKCLFQVLLIFPLGWPVFSYWLGEFLYILWIKVFIYMVYITCIYYICIIVICNNCIFCKCIFPLFELPFNSAGFSVLRL